MPLMTLLVLAVLTVLFFQYWDRESLHYRLTYEVYVDGKLRTGSGVIKLGNENENWFLGTNSQTWASGEAVVVELDERRHLFSLLNNAHSLPLVSVGVKYGNETRADRIRALKTNRDSATLTSDQLPMLVAFANLDDPESVFKVDPKNLEAAFGPGVELKRVVIEITSAPVTDGRIEQLLRWLPGYRENQYRLNGEMCDTCPVQSENLADFIEPDFFKTDRIF